MATFTYTPSYSTSLAQEPKILEAKFGDGYEQAIFNGLKHSPESWSIKFTSISATEVQNIISFFVDNNTATTPFDWTNPNGISGRYKCRQWTRTYDGFEPNGLTCTFDEVFW